MATFDYDSNEDQAPQRFEISSSTESAGSQLSIYFLKCSLCSKSRKRFHCKNCVQNGDFVHSTHNFPERFFEKQFRYSNLKTSLRKCNETCGQILQDRKVYENLKGELQRKRKRIQLLRNIISDIKARVNTNIKYRDNLTKENSAKRIVHPKYEGKVKDLENYVMDRMQKNRKLEEEKMDLLLTMKDTIRSDIGKLLKYIFPTSHFTSEFSSSKSDKSSSTLSKDLLAHDIDLLNVQSGEVEQDKETESYYVIVAPYLPANGNYSAYIDWVTNNKDGVPSSTGSETLPSANPAYRISAALTYATQLVNLLSFYLDVRLPYKLAYSDFCKQELTEQQFIRKVARLNLNTLYLCYTQHVQISSLNPNHTLENILKLLDTSSSNLGRIGPVDVIDVPLKSSIDAYILQDLDLSIEYESDEDQSFRLEWEAVPHVSPSETATVLPPPNTQQTASMAGGLVTSAAASIASIWRGWTTGR